MKKKYKEPQVECEQVALVNVISLSPKAEKTEDMYGYEESEQYVKEMEEESQADIWGSLWK